MIRGVDDRRVGLIVRMLRRRRGWRQRDLADLGGCSQSFVSQLERGHIDRASVSAVRRILAVLDARLEVDIRWRGGEVDRLLDARHAALVGQIVGQMLEGGWLTAVEVTYAKFGERGSIDVMAFHPEHRALVVVEVKSELTSLEETLRRLDQKVRLGPAVARERLGWVATRGVSRLLVLPETSTARDRLKAHAAVLDSTLPLRGLALRRWLEQPLVPSAGIKLLRNSNPHGGKRPASGSHRIRAARVGSRGTRPNVDPALLEQQSARRRGSQGESVV